MLVYASLPPLGIAPLVWIAPWFWLLLVRRPELRGKGVWFALWVAGLLHWLLILEGIRKAHWANYFGWLALAGYLAAYLPMFIWLTRVAVHRVRIPLGLAAPIVWTGLELARGHLITGFSMASLGHAIVGWTALIQIADLFGAYGVSFLIMFTCASLFETATRKGRRWRFAPAAVAALSVACAWGYGMFRLNSAELSSGRSLKVALLQGTVDKVFEFNPERNEGTFQAYLRLAEHARDQRADLDLIIWPESVFTANAPDLMFEPPVDPPLGATMSREEFQTRVERTRRAFREKAKQTADRVNRVWADGKFDTLDIHQVVGCETVLLKGSDVRDYNAALLVDPAGQITDRYFKMHPVMFGEYVPFGDVFPWLYRLTPLGQGLSRGDGAKAFSFKGYLASPSVCFESSVPHLIRGHVRELAERGEDPDVLINLSDDGWFWGASILDYQLHGAVFRAVELRRPFLVAANAGLSAAIDASGHILAEGRRHQDAAILADVPCVRSSSFYLRWGDLPAGCCLAVCIGLLFYPFLGGVFCGSRAREKSQRGQVEGGSA